MPPPLGSCFPGKGMEVTTQLSGPQSITWSILPLQLQPVSVSPRKQATCSSSHSSLPPPLVTIGVFTMPCCLYPGSCQVKMSKNCTQDKQFHECCWQGMCVCMCVCGWQCICRRDTSCNLCFACLKAECSQRYSRLTANTYIDQFEEVRSRKATLQTERVQRVKGWKGLLAACQVVTDLTWVKERAGCLGSTIDNAMMLIMNTGKCRCGCILFKK